MKRRTFLKQGLHSGSALLAGLFGGGMERSVLAAAGEAWHMPDEAETHAATWMAFGPSVDIWGERLKDGAQDSLASIARAISRYETVHMLVREEDYDTAARKCGNAVKLMVQPLDDLWMRDTGPVFVKNPQGKLAAVNFNFNGWGEKQEYERDAQVARFVSQRAGVSLLRSGLVLEGGGIEVDGEGTAIITESCVLNPNRNPGVSKAQCEAELKRLLGLEKIIWLPGIAGRDITDGHTDFYARFTSPGVVVAGYEADTTSEEHLVTKRHLDILCKARDAKGRLLKIVVLAGPSSVRSKYENKDFAAGYINFYVCNSAVIAAEFGDSKTDRNTRSILRELFPTREIIQLNVDAIAAGGGGIHCTTQQQPL
ncbi:MAG: agmatine deiminase family protein [Pseudomonadota bacterium]